jgi:glycosyltransferase involved in cell wall biosynthesis
VATEKKHILIITPGFPKDETDDTCIPPLQEFLNSFTSLFPDSKFTVISLHYPYLYQKYFWKGIPVFPLSGKDAGIKKPFLWYNAIKLAKKIHTRNRIDIIHSFWLGECAMLGYRLSIKLNLPHLNTLMGQELNVSNRYFRFINLKKMKVAALSEKQASLFRNKTGQAVDEIIPWGIGDDDIVTDNTKREIDLLGVGSLISGKNFEMFIELVCSIRKQFPDIKAAIIGEGTAMEKLSNLISSYKLDDTVKLTGKLKRGEVLKMMRRSKILLHTSMYESFGYVLAEALASGCYVVCTKTGFAKKTNKMFIAENKNEFIRIILDLLNKELNFTPEVPFTAGNTSLLYNNLYENSINEF